MHSTTKSASRLCAALAAVVVVGELPALCACVVVGARVVVTGWRVVEGARLPLRP